jgi:hypothetical protein
MERRDPVSLALLVLPVVYLGGGYVFFRHLEARFASAREKNERVRDSLL